MSRQLLQSLGIKVAFGGVQNDEVAIMLVTIFLAGLFVFTGFQTVKNIFGLEVVQHIITEFFLFCDCSFHRFHIGANIA